MAQRPSPIVGYSEYGQPIYGPPPPRNTGLVIALVAMGAVLVVVLAVGGVFLVMRSPSSGDSTVAMPPPMPSRSSDPTPTYSVTPSQTGSVPYSGGPSYSTSSPYTANSAPSPTQQSGSGYTVSGADGQGFTSSGPRCNYTNPAVAIGRTARSKLVICQTGVGRYYYKGTRLSDGAPLELSDPTPSGSGYTAYNGATKYTVTSSALTITQNGSTVTSEPMLDYWSN